MAENRLLREDNPEPGERRGYVPQHLEAGSQEYSKTEGSDGRLHTKSMIVDQNGEPFEKENPVPVQLTGSKVQDVSVRTKETIFERNVINSNKQHTITTPPGARGMMLMAPVWAATGTFNSDEGLRMRVHIGVSSHLRRLELSTGSSYGTESELVIISYPGATKGDLSTTSTSSFAIAGLPVFETMEIELRVSGSFGTSEGIDCECWAEWLY